MSTNRRIAKRNLAAQESLDFSGAGAVLGPQSCDVLVYIGTESPDARGGCGRYTIPGSGDTQRRACTDEPVACSSRTNIEEICTLLTFVILAVIRPFIASIHTVPRLVSWGRRHGRLRWTQVSSSAYG